MGWNGQFNGRDVPADVYAWFAEVVFLDGEVAVLKGDVLLIR